MCDISPCCMLCLTVGDVPLTLVYSLLPRWQPVPLPDRTRNIDAIESLTVRKRTTQWHRLLGMAFGLGAVLITCRPMSCSRVMWWTTMLARMSRFLCLTKQRQNGTLTHSTDPIYGNGRHVQTKLMQNARLGSRTLELCIIRAWQTSVRTSTHLVMLK